MKKIIYILLPIMALFSCTKAKNNGNQSVSNVAKTTSEMTEVLIGKNAETTTIMQVSVQDETTMVKWKSKSKVATEQTAAFLAFNEDVIYYEDEEELVVKLIPNEQYYYIPADNPGNPVNLKFGMNQNPEIRIKCRCTIATSVLGPGKCSSYHYIANNHLHLDCQIDEYCAWCHADVTVVEKIVNLGPGLLIKAPSINVLPL